MGFHGGSSPAVQPLPPAPTIEDPAVKEAEQAERDRLRRMRGRSSTIIAGKKPLLPPTILKQGLKAKLGGT